MQIFQPKVIENEKDLICKQHQQQIEFVILDAQLSSNERLLCKQCKHQKPTNSQIGNFQQLKQSFDRIQREKISQYELIIKPHLQQVEEFKKTIEALKTRLIQQLDYLLCLSQDWITQLIDIATQYSFFGELDLLIQGLKSKINPTPIIETIKKTLKHNKFKATQKLNQFKLQPEFNRCQELFENLNHLLQNQEAEIKINNPYFKDNNMQLEKNSQILDKYISFNIKQEIQPQYPYSSGDVPRKDINYPGIQNEGQHCYMNAVMQCLAETPFLSNFLYNQSFKNFITSSNSGEKWNNSQPIQIILTEQLSLLIKKLKDTNEQSVSIEQFREAVCQKILDSQKRPIYKICEPADSNEFLKDLLEHISDELKGSNKQKNTIIDTLFQGTKKTKTFCKQCAQEVEFDEKINIFDLNVLKMKDDECRLQLMFFSKYKLIETQTKEIVLKKQRVVLQNNQKIKELYQQITKITNLNKDQYTIAYKNKGSFCRIPDNYDQYELFKLGISSKKTIYVYELGNQDEAEKEFIEISQIFNYPSSDFKLYDIVNFKPKDNIWREGQIVDIQENQYEIKDCSSDQKYRINNLDISQFRKKVQNQRNMVKIEVYNYLNQSKNNKYKQILYPMIILIPIKSITFQELKVYIYKQIQRFININEFQVKPNLYNTWGLEEELKKSFDQSEFPYRILILDAHNKCLNCKKTSIIVNNRQTNCKGCEVDPIILNFDYSIKPKIILVWTQTQKYLKQLKIESDYDFKLEDYLKQYKSTQELTKICQNCKIPLFEQTFLFVAPIILVIHLPKLIRTQVYFEIQSQNIRDCLYKINDVLYNLYAVINLKQIIADNQQYTYQHHTAYVKKQDQWIEFNDSKIKKIDLHKITSKNACLLFYIRQEIKDDVIFLLQSFF
ncbi:unnamed protein product [Paramecium sonneborni]|uniref:USP domain-containing protein n=1 Tax=Paramecium sonneborni TaxID=65129 RepID=A0A8S1RTU3_9CILI|nr:unnamed protein product [Paramecium sonneborni]